MGFEQSKACFTGKRVPPADGDASRGKETLRGETGGQSIRTCATGRKAFWQGHLPTGAHIHSGWGHSG